MNAEQAKFLAEHYARIIENEIPTTSKVIAAVGQGNGDYKPDGKSRSAIELARHIATSDPWFVQSALDGKFEFNPVAAQQAEAGAGDVLEQQRRTAGGNHPAVDLRRLEMRRDRRLHRDEVSVTAKAIEKRPEVGKAH
jgi:hypothetical protein